jgi:hypothetical protein
MTQFSIDHMTRVTIGNVNVRSELHGDEHVPAADISFKLTTSNAILSEFDGQLRGMLYEAVDAPNTDQAELEGVEAVSDLPKLRSVWLDQPLRLKNEYLGYSLTIDRGLGGASNIVLGECAVNKIKADCNEGGSVELGFRVQAAKLSADVLGKLATLIGCEVSITLTPPEVKQDPIDGTEGHPGAKTGKDDTVVWPFPKQKDATDTFVEQHGVKA